MTTVLDADPRVAPDELPARAGALLDAGFRVALIAGHDDRAAGAGLRAVYLFLRAAAADGSPERRVELHVDIDPAQPRVPSLAGISFSAGRLLWFVHRGVEKLLQARTPEAGVALAERISGDTSVGHALAFCQAIEDARGQAVPEDVRRRRAVLLELERLYNHVGDIGALCNDVAYAVLDAHAQRVREQLLRINDEVTGHRVHSETGGDVLARFCVRAEEIAASIAIITALVSAPVTDPPEPTSKPGPSGVGIVEGWRGTIVHRVELATDGTLTRTAVVDPSFFNWPALPVAMTDTIVPDFPLANKSFNLSYAGNDL